MTKTATKFPLTDPEERRDEATKRRQKAAALSNAYPFPPQVGAVLDECPPYVFNFRKGLRHEPTGLTSDADYADFRVGTTGHRPEPFAMAKLNVSVDALAQGPKQTPPPPINDKVEGREAESFFRQWESPTAGYAYVMQGPDPFALTMPPAPRPGSAELAAEMAEVYEMALLRDRPVAACMSGALVAALAGDMSPADAKKLKADEKAFAAAAERLSALRWFRGQDAPNDTKTPALRQRRRFGERPTTDTLFRGQGEDPWDTPFLSQFMVMGAGDPSRPAAHLAGRKSGVIRYGAQRIDQKVRVATPGRDYMTGWNDWRDVQNALDARKTLRLLTSDAVEQGDADKAKDLSEDLLDQNLQPQFRPMARLRDLATYVHDDQLYQAYLNAALLLLAEDFPLDPGIPFHRRTANPAGLDGWNREPFALFGPPHLLTLVTEVSSRALKAVRLQKFAVHNRQRPESLAALFHTMMQGYRPDSVAEIPVGSPARGAIAAGVARYLFPDGQGTEPSLAPTLSAVLAHNKTVNARFGAPPTHLLPMAFPEGSPMHPAYGAGHATVAGACVTLLKAFFAMRDKDSGKPVYVVRPNEAAMVPDPGAGPEDAGVGLLELKMPHGLTLEGELNKLCWNISNGRNIAGVHYYTDYVESAILGENVTLGILREQMAAYDPAEMVSMTVPLFVERTLPEALLTPGAGVSAGEPVAAVRIDPHGALHKADLTPRTP